MTDIEITRLCAEAVGWSDIGPEWNSAGHDLLYNPLHDDAQAMALVKKLKILLYAKPMHGFPDWRVEITNYNGANSLARAEDADLNRAICECVAKLQVAK